MSCLRLLSHFVHELFHEVHGFDDEVGGGGVAAANEAFSGFAKGIARDDGDALLFEKTEGELLAGEAGAADLGEDVEGSSGIEAVQAHAVQAADDDVSAHLVALAHFFIGAGAHFEGLDAGDLAHDGSAEHAVLVDLHHGLTQRGRGAGIAETPASHGEGFAEAVQEHGALSHAGVFDNAFVLASVVEQFAVDLVGEDKQIVLHGEGGDFFQLLGRHDAAGGIRGEVQRDDLGLRRDGFLHVGGHEGEVIFLTRVHHNRHAVGHLDARAVADVAGLVVNDFVARIQNGAEGDVESLTDADGDEDLGLRVVGDTELLFHVFADEHAEGLQAEVRSVAGLAFFQRADDGLADRPGGGFVGLTDAEGDDIRAANDELEEVANARAREVADLGAKFIVIVHEVGQRQG
ncbi:MAG: hypothetical protein RL015_1210 [Verrucomicrobiota bacterium]